MIFRVYLQIMKKIGGKAQTDNTLNSLCNSKIQEGEGIYH